MRYKAVCEELWSIWSDAPTRLLYRETRTEGAVWRLGPAVTRGRETRRMLKNNKNKHPRSEAR